MSPSRLVPLLLSIALGGCAAVPAEREAAEAPQAPAVPTPAPVALPDNEMTVPLLYDLLVAEVAMQRGELLLAGRNYLNAAWDTRDPRIAQRAARVALFARDMNSALEAAELWVSLSPDDLDGRQSLAALLIHAGRAEEAAIHLERLLVLAPDSTQGFQVVVNLLSREADKAHALTLFERLAEPRRDEPDALYAHAQLAMMLGRQELALTKLEELLKKRPRWAKALVLRANVLRHLNRTDEALASYSAAVKAEPKDAGLRLGYARALVDERRLEDARAQFEALAEQLPDNSDVGYALGLLALQAGELKRAEQQFRRLVESGQHADEAAFSLGQIAESRGELDESLRWYDAVAEGNHYLEARIRTAGIKARRDGVDAAREYLHSLDVNSADEQVSLYLAEGELLRQHERYAEALLVYDQAVAQNPDHPDLRYARAMVAERLDRLDLLEQDLRRILEADPANVQALNALGYTLADRTDRFEEAHDLIRRALEQQPEDPAINDSMGWVLFQLGRYEEAEQYLKRAAESMQDPEVAAHLGELYWVTGRRNEARAVWDAGLKQSPDNRLIKQVIERLTR